MDNLAEKFNLARRELLDLSLKNPLLNFKLRKGMGLEFSSLNASDVFDYLVGDGKNVSFTREESNLPSKLTVNLDEKELRRRLVKTFRTSKLYLEEKGANILFLALGFLKWKENDSDENYYRAPLILVPVEINKQENVDRYFITYSDEEIRYNISLITKLQTEFGINIEKDDDDDIKNINRYFRYVDDQIAHSSFSSWEVETTSGALDFFSYAKFLMYKDLDLSLWLDKKNKFNSPLMKKLFITNFDDKENKDIDINAISEPEELFNVVNADSSQSEVIYDINNGMNMVIQGPPGTGKSQTITNIIASSVAHKKSVLFIAEKKAALDVVKRRLENVGLGDLVLELHSQMTNKKEVLKSIEKTLNLGEPKVDDDTLLVKRYQDIKQSLNGYQHLVNTHLDDTTSSLVNIYGESLKVKDKLDQENVRVPKLKFPHIETWTEEDYRKREEITREYVDALKNIGKVEKHPLYGVMLTSCQPYEQVAIKEKLNDLDDALNNLIATFNEIGSIFNNKTCNTLFETGRYIASIDAIVKYKKLGSINCMDPTIYEDKKNVLDLIDRSKKAQEFLNDHGEDYAKEKFDEVDDFIKAYEKYLSLGYFKRKKETALINFLRTYLVNYKNEKNKYQLYYEHAKDMQILNANDDYLRYLFASSYKGIYDTPWGEVTRNIDIAKEFLSLIYEYAIIPQSRQVIQDEEKIEKLVELKDSFIEQKDNFVNKLNDFITSTKFDDVMKFGYHSWYNDYTFTELRKVVTQWRTNIDSILELTRYNALNEEFKNLGMKDLLDYANNNNKFEYLPEILAVHYFDMLIEKEYKAYPDLNNVKKFRMDRNVDLFKELDNKMMVENIKHILKIHYDNMPRLSDNGKDMNVIRRELQKKRNQMPIRKLIAKTSETIKRIKPVFMMSPISVANFLDPNQVTFDLVVFDEASQVRPVEAFGALLRAKQIVVVGDSKQLPPTTFFDTMTNKFDDVDDEDYDISNMESILSLLLSKNIPQRTLSWHYRSRHQSLINISNNEFYDHTLKVFPSVNDRDPSQGLVFHYLENTYYDRGGTRTNRLEAKAVVKAVIEHATLHPEMSLGVASFSLAQSEEIYKEFENQLKKVTDNKVREFFTSMHKDEPFFIKNLESVQGDERDVIFISVGYGYDQEHNITMDFGPLNKEGGERRLNVLITRAKYKCEVFSNITSHDINLSKTSSIGVAALKRFLEYAQNRVIFKTKVNENVEDEFVDYLADKISEYGYEVDQNVGKEVGIDLAIYDKELGRYTLGIECDGGAYKELDSCIDRERIRRNVLKSLGWRLYHVYSPEFYRNTKNELEKILEYIADAKKDVQQEIENKPVITVERKKSEELKHDDVLAPYVLYQGPKRRSAVLQDKEGLATLIEKIMQKESPMHLYLLKKRLCEITNQTRISDEQSSLINEIILENNDKYDYFEEFVSLKDQEKIYVRNRSALDNASRKVDYIPPQELTKAVLYALSSGDAANENELSKVLSAYFGFNKSAKLTERIHQLVNDLLEKKKIYLDDEILYVADDTTI